MTVSDVVTKVAAFSKNDTLNRVLKTVVEVVAAQTALYTTVVPNPPNTNTSAAIAAGAGVLALVWNLALSWATNTKSARLDKLAQAIDDAVDKRLATQAAQQRQVPVAVDPGPAPDPDAVPTPPSEKGVTS